MPLNTLPNSMLDLAPANDPRRAELKLLVEGKPTYREATHETSIRCAWEHHVLPCGRNAAGVDGVSKPQFAAHAEKNLRRLSMDLLTGEFKASPVRRISVPKEDGRPRNIGIPTVRDRITGRAVQNTIKPFVDPILSNDTYSRFGRSNLLAIQVVEELARWSHFALRLDFADFFETIHHDLLLAMFEEPIEDPRLKSFIRGFVKCGWAGIDGKIHRSKIGISQGGVLSPLFANLYLADFSRRIHNNFGPHVVFTDDVAIFGNNARSLDLFYRQCCHDLPRTLGLRLHPDKSGVIDLSKRPLQFLGFEFDGRFARPQMKRAPLIANAVVAEPRWRRKKKLLHDRLVYYNYGATGPFLKAIKDHLPRDHHKLFHKVVKAVRLSTLSPRHERRERAREEKALGIIRGEGTKVPGARYMNGSDAFDGYYDQEDAE